jgi:hypothetical protein
MKPVHCYVTEYGVGSWVHCAAEARAVEARRVADAGGGKWWRRQRATEAAKGGGGDRRRRRRRVVEAAGS